MVPNPKPKIQLSDLHSPDKLFDLIEVFINSQDVRASTRESYLKDLRQFRIWFLHLKLKEISQPMLLSFKKHLELKHKKPLTISNYILHARRFLEWAGYGDEIEGVKGAKRDRGFRKDPLTVDQIMELLDVFDRSQIQGKRDYAIINLMLRTGLRTNEVIKADIGDIRQVGGQAVLYVHGKGRSEKNEFVILTPETLRPINDYLLERKVKGDEYPLFSSLSHRTAGSRLATRSIRWIVKDYLRKIGINSERISAHSMRHTAVTLALLGGASIQEAMAMARHANINTTMIYSHNIDRIGDAAEKKIDRYLKK